MTSIKSQKNCFPAIKSTKQMFPSSLEWEKTGSYVAISNLTNTVAAI